MWQLSWMLSLLPEWFWTAVLILGIVGLLASWLLKFVPFVKQYALIIQVASIIALLTGVYFEGMYANEAKWRNEIAEMQKKVDEANASAAAATRNIETKVEVQTKVIREKGKTQIQYVDRVVSQDKEVIKYIENCPVPKIIIDEHNKATVPPEAIKELNNSAEGKK